MSGPIDFFAGGFIGTEEVAQRFLALDHRAKLLVGGVVVGAATFAVREIAAGAPMLTGATRWAVGAKIIRSGDQTTAVIGPKHAQIALQSATTARGQTKLIGTRTTKTGRTVRVKLAKGASTRGLSRAGTVVDPGKYARLVEEGHGGKEPAAPHPWFRILVAELAPLLARFVVNGMWGLADGAPTDPMINTIDAISTAGAFTLRQRPNKTARDEGRLRAFTRMSGGILRAKVGAFVLNRLAHLVVARADKWRREQAERKAKQPAYARSMAEAREWLLSQYREKRLAAQAAKERSGEIGKVALDSVRERFKGRRRWRPFS